MEYTEKIEAGPQEYVFKNPGHHVHYSKSGNYKLWGIALSWIDLDESICEIGCGSGQFAHMASDYSFDYVIGIDFSPTGIELFEALRKEYDFIAEFYLADAREINYYEDVIVCFSVLEHIKNDLSVIKRIPSGKKFIFIVPSFDDIRHVRSFENKKAIYRRYGDLLDIEKIVKYKPKFYRKRCQYLVKSIIK